MAFKTHIVRKDKDASVQMKVKIVTKSKKQSIKFFKDIIVKAAAETDLQLCQSALAVRKSEFEKAAENNTMDLQEGINYSLIAVTSRKVQLKYELEESNSYPAGTVFMGTDGKYFDPNRDGGIVNIKPKFGDNDVAATLKMTASYGKESVSSYIDIAIKAYTTQEVLAKLKAGNERNEFQDELWKKLVGSNNEQSIEKTADRREIYSKTRYKILNLSINKLREWTPWNDNDDNNLLSSGNKFKIYWDNTTIDDRNMIVKCTDNIFSSALGLQDRINPTVSGNTITNASINNITYRDAVTKISNTTGVTQVPGTNGAYFYMYYDIPGLTLTVPLVLEREIDEGEIQREYDEFVYNITTRSQSVSNEDIMKELSGGIGALSEGDLYVKDNTYGNFTFSKIFKILGYANPDGTRLSLLDEGSIEESCSLQAYFMVGNSNQYPTKNDINDLPDILAADGTSDKMPHKIVINTETSNEDGLYTLVLPKNIFTAATGQNFFVENNIGINALKLTPEQISSSVLITDDIRLVQIDDYNTELNLSSSEWNNIITFSTSDSVHGRRFININTKNVRSEKMFAIKAKLRVDGYYDVIHSTPYTSVTTDLVIPVVLTPSES